MVKLLLVSVSVLRDAKPVNLDSIMGAIATFFPIFYFFFSFFRFTQSFGIFEVYLHSPTGMHLNFPDYTQLSRFDFLSPYASRKSFSPFHIFFLSFNTHSRFTAYQLFGCSYLWYHTQTRRWAGQNNGVLDAWSNTAWPSCAFRSCTYIFFCFFRSCND